MALSPEEKIEKTVRRASSLIWRVDLGGALFASAAAAVFLLMGGILLDHLLPDGLSEKGRLLYALSAGALFLGIVFWRFYPLVRCRINPLYSAERLEEAHPQLKNGLVNWLLTRGGGKDAFERPLARITAESIPEGAESDAVDMRPLVRPALFFIASMTLAAVYLVTSQRSCFVSAARLLMPTARIAAPQPVRFRLVEPGDYEARPGEEVTVRAEFDDVPPGDVCLSYSTADGRIAGARLPMEREGALGFTRVFPESGRGVEEDVIYEILVTDGGRVKARSPEYRIRALPPVTFSPVKAVYRYPAYTGLGEMTAEGDGNLDAWEGTEVTLVARCNYPLARAALIPDFKRSEELTMKVSAADPALAEVRFTLEAGKYTSYRLWCADSEKNVNIAEPEDPAGGAPVWTISVRPDPDPVAVWSEPAAGGAVRVAEHGSLPLAFTGTDEYFGAARAEMELVWHPAQRQAEKKTVTVDLTAQLNRPDADRRGPSVLKLDFTPAASGIPAGATVECRGVLYDNRPGEPGRGETGVLTVSVVRDEEAPGTETGDEKDGDGAGSQGDSSRPERGGEGDSQKSSGGQGEDRSSGGGKKDEGERNQASGDDSSQGEGESGEGESGQGDPPPAQEEPNGGEEDNAEGTGESAGESASAGESGSEPGDSDTESGGDPAGAEQTGRRGGTETDGTGEQTGGASAGTEGTEGEAPGGERIDPDSEPADVFDAILDFSGLDAEAAPSDAEPQGRGTGVSSPDTEKKAAEADPDELDQIKAAPGTPPDGPRQSDRTGGEIPAGAARERGNVDPNTRNFMATAGEGDPGAQAPAGAQVRQDPDLNPGAAAPGAGEEGNEMSSGEPAGGGIPEAGGGEPNRGGDVPEMEPAGGESRGASAAAGGDVPGDGKPVTGGSGSAAGKDREGEAAAADKANLEYTEKATNLVLNYLDEELRSGPDRELLDRLGWTAEELRAFHEKWTEMREKAGEDLTGRHRYEEELRDMGLRPKGVRLSGRGADRKDADSARTAGRIATPPDFEERVREYRKALHRD